MAYALHRRAAFRQGVSAIGWNFDLTKSEYVNSATLLNSQAPAVNGSAVSPRRLFLPADSSFLLEQESSITRRYNFPAGHYGDIYYLQNAPYSISHTTNSVLNSVVRPIAFSADGLHFVRQGRVPSQGNQHDVYSCPLDSAFDISSIQAWSDMSAFYEYTEMVEGLAFSSDGLFLLVLSTASMRSYYLSVPFDVSSASLVYTQVSFSRFTSNCGISNVASDPNHFRDWQFSPDGFILTLLWSKDAYDTGVFFVFKLSAPFNISTMSFDHVWDLGTNYVHGFAIDRAGQNLYIARSTTILQYALSA